ncbi:hypothetical protein [Amycolatopsis sp. NPDC003731]
MTLRIPDIKSEHMEILDAAHVLGNFRDRAERDIRLRTLNDEAQRRGGRFDPSPANAFGFRHSFTSTRPIRPGPSGPNLTVNSVEFELQAQEYPTEAADKVVVGVAGIRAGDQSASYPVLLEAPAGDFVGAREFTAVGDRIEPTESWWTAITGCLTRQCVSVCASSVATCLKPGQSWVQYVGCLAWNCGGCWVKCLGCATCNCGWWCQWAVGCCHQ